ncbi:MAG: ABC transporter permease [Bacteroidales bacterium]|nr:ABC transporter permease [Bacteroidales bacterium]
MKALWQSIKYGYSSLCRRRLYLICMIFVPLLCCLFFLSLLQEGLPVRVPTAIVDLDHSSMSRAMTRNLDSQQYVDITESAESYDAALGAVRAGRVFGFYVIPANFQRDALSGRKPVINYYSNMTYFVPGTFSYKGYKTLAVQATASMVQEAASEKGISDRTIEALVKPMSIDINPVHNPWTNYSMYLTPSFSAGVLELMIILVTIMTLTYEIKYGTSRQWLRNSHGSIILAVTGKLLPQTVIFTITGWCMQGLLFGISQFPVLCPLWVLALSMPFFVLACQGFGLMMSCIFPNPRFALATGTLVAILAFSLTGFSFPVQNMYGAVGIFSYIVPVRYYFLIHIQQVLNGTGLYYSRMYFVALIIMTFLPALMLWRFKHACIRQQYVP